MKATKACRIHLSVLHEYHEIAALNGAASSQSLSPVRNLLALSSQSLMVSSQFS